MSGRAGRRLDAAPRRPSAGRSSRRCKIYVGRVLGRDRAARVGVRHERDGRRDRRSRHTTAGTVSGSLSSSGACVATMRRRVLDHEREPALWIRSDPADSVGAAGLENAEHADDHVQRTLDQQTDGRAVFDAASPEHCAPAGWPAGSDRRRRDPCAITSDDRLRCALGLSLEKLMDRLPRIGRLRGCARHELLPLLSGTIEAPKSVPPACRRCFRASAGSGRPRGRWWLHRRDPCCTATLRRGRLHLRHQQHEIVDDGLRATGQNSRISPPSSTCRRHGPSTATAPDPRGGAAC